MKMFWKGNTSQKCIHGEALQVDYRSQEITSMHLLGPELCDWGYAPNSLHISSGYSFNNFTLFRSCSDTGDQLLLVLLPCNFYETFNVHRGNAKNIVMKLLLTKNDTFNAIKVDWDPSTYSGYLTRQYLQKPVRETPYCPLLFNDEKVAQKTSRFATVAFILLVIVLTVLASIYLKFYSTNRVNPIVGFTP